MCELFGVTAKKKFKINGFLNAFFNHSVEHRNGWGLAVLDAGPGQIVKEPKRAIDSKALNEMLKSDIETSCCIAHIRKATIGGEHKSNTHPFVGFDRNKRKWVLAHNGTIFDADILAPYQYMQSGDTDSERILLYIIDEINKESLKQKTKLSGIQRVKIVEEAIKKLSHGNKLNLLIYDGEYIYVHKNEEGTLYKKEEKDAVFFSTVPLGSEEWKEFPGNRLQVYQNGKLIYTGKEHENTYVHNEENMKLLYLAYSGL